MKEERESENGGWKTEIAWSLLNEMVRARVIVTVIRRYANRVQLL